MRSFVSSGEPPTDRIEEGAHAGEERGVLTQLSARLPGERHHLRAAFGVVVPVAQPQMRRGQWHEARGDHERMKVWTNTVLGETWREEAREIDHASLLHRREVYAVPEDVLVIVASPLN